MGKAHSLIARMAAESADKISLTRLLVASLLSEGMPIKIRTAQGGVIDGDFTGYWGPGTPCVGYPLSSGAFSHGMLHPGDEIITPVPSYDEWEASEQVSAA